MRTTSLIVRADGDHLQIAKWSKDQQMCPLCLELRAIALRHSEELFAFQKGQSISPLSCQWFTPFAKETILAVASFVADSDALGPFGYDVYLPFLRLRRFRIETHSSCPLCTTPIDDGSMAASVRLAPCPKNGPREYRRLRPSDMEIPVDTYLNPVCGMFGPHFYCRRNHSFVAQVVGSFHEPARPFLSMAWSGRKNSYRSSLAIGLLEAFERHAGLKMRGKRVTVFDSYRNLRDQALDPRDCGLYSNEYYEGNRGLTPFSEDIRLRWVWGYSLTQGRAILVPLQLAYYGERIADEPRIIQDNSNGCASGTSIEEAIFFGLLEVIERDAFVIHWQLRLSPPQVDLGSICDADLLFLVDRLYRLNLDVYLLDARLDIPVPSIIAVIKRRDEGLGAFVLAMGCHFDPVEAMRSALVEAAGRQEGFKERTAASETKLRAALADFGSVRTMEDHAALYGLPEALKYAHFLIENKVKRPLKDTYLEWQRGVPNTLDLQDDIKYCMDLLASAGLKQIVVVDQTSPEQLRAGLRTVRVLVPGMMPLDFGHGRCRAAALPRLHSIPVKLGMRPNRLDPGELNGVPHPFS